MRPANASRLRSMRSPRPWSGGARPIAARRRSTPSCTRSGPTARGSPPSSMPRPRAPGPWRPPIARSPSGSTPPSPPFAPCSRPTSAEITSGGDAMPQVSVTINGRQFRMACGDGEEAHLMRLAEDLDGRISRLRARFGEIGDTRLTVMAALTLADELSETKEKLQRLEPELTALQDASVASADRAQVTQAAVSAALNSAAERIEGITRRLNETLRDDKVAMG